MRALALILGRHAARLMDPVRPQQAAAMYAEIENLDDRAALAWAVGCVAASYRQRASILAVAVVSARLCVAAAAGLFGLMHVVMTGGNLWCKLALLNGQTPPLTRTHIEGLQSLPLDYWVRNFVLLGLVIGCLHLLAALLMAAGRNDKLQQVALFIIGIEALLPLIGLAGGLTLPIIYVGLMTLMAATSSVLAWIWRWDERRLAHNA